MTRTCTGPRASPSTRGARWSPRAGPTRPRPPSISASPSDTMTHGRHELVRRLDGIPADKDTVKALDKAHVFHSWSAQGLIDPLPIASAEGSYFTDYDGKRYLDFSSQLVNVNIGYQHPKLIAAIQEYAGRMTTIQPSFANDARSEAARLICELAPGRPEPDLLHQRRRRGHRERDAHGQAAHRPAQGARRLPQLPRRHGRRDHDDRRPAPLGGRAGDARRRPLLGPVPVPLGLPLVHAGGGDRARAAAPARPDHGRGRADDRGDHPRDGRGHERHPRPAAGLPGRRARDLRRVRHRDDRRRGDGRLRPVRRVVRDRPLGGHARPADLRQGRQLRLRPPRRRADQRRHRRDVRPAGLPGRPDLQRSPSRVRQRRRVDQHLQGRGHHRERAPARHRRDRARAGQDRRPAPVGGRGARARASSGPSSW